MLWAILITMHMFGLVSYTILLRKISNRKLDKIFTATVMSTALWIPSIFYIFTGKVQFDLTFHQWSFLILGSFFVAGLHITNVWALAHLDASMFTILYNLRLLVVTVLGYFILGELPTKLQIVGGIIILSSILMLNLHVDSRWKSKPILIGLFTMLWFSFHATIEKYNISEINIETYIFIFFTLGTLFLWILVFYKRTDVKTQMSLLADRQIALLLFTRAISAYSYIYALKQGDLAISNYISGMSVVVVVLFGIYYLGERNEKKQKLIATAIALVGMTLIFVSKI